MLFADTHVHLYPCYDINAALGSAFANLGALAPEGATMAIFLTERHDCNFFRQQLKSGSRNIFGDSFTVEDCFGENVVLVKNRDGRALYIFAGRQIVTRERLEVLALTLDANIPDGGSVLEVINAIISGGGIPVLPWAPGKWFGRRGRIVREVIESTSPDKLLIGDSSLRPLGWGEPALIRNTIGKGFKVIAGTDPLPFSGEERNIGRYGISCDAVFDEKKPLSGIRRLLTSPSVAISRVGRRNCPLTAFRRLLANRNSRK